MTIDNFKSLLFFLQYLLSQLNLCVESFKLIWFYNLHCKVESSQALFRSLLRKLFNLTHEHRVLATLFQAFLNFRVGSFDVKLKAIIAWILHQYRHAFARASELNPLLNIEAQLGHILLILRFSLTYISIRIAFKFKLLFVRLFILLVIDVCQSRLVI